MELQIFWFTVDNVDGSESIIIAKIHDMYLALVTPKLMDETMDMCTDYRLWVFLGYQLCDEAFFYATGKDIFG